MKFAPRDYWCSPGLRHRTPTWPSSSGSRPRCILLTNLSWCCPEVAVSACRWPGPPGAVRPVSSCLRPPSTANLCKTPEPLPPATAPSSSKIRTFPFKGLNTLYKQGFFCFVLFLTSQPSFHPESVSGVCVTSKTTSESIPEVTASVGLNSIE